MFYYHTLIRCPLATQVNIIDYDGRTPLGVAASQGNIDAVKYLLAHGANYSIKDIRCASSCLGDDHYSYVADLQCRGNTPFEDAKREKRDSVVKLLGKRHESSRIVAFKFVAFLTSSNPQIHGFQGRNQGLNLSFEKFIT